MLKRLFRIAVLLILLFWLSQYTSIFDNTKIKPYFDRIEVILQDRLPNSKPTQEISNVVTTGENQEPPSVTWANSFEDADLLENGMVDSNMPISTGALPEEELTVVEDKTTMQQTHTGLAITNCHSPWWKFVPENGYIIAYESTSSTECKRERRYCNEGKLQWSYQHDTCYYTTAIANQQQSSLLNEQEVRSLIADYGSFGIAIAAEKSREVTGTVTLLDKQVWPGVIVSSSQHPKIYQNSDAGFYQTDNPVNKSVNDPNKHYILRITNPQDGSIISGKPIKSIAILANGQTELNNTPLKARSLKKQLRPWGDAYYSNQKTLGVKNSYERKFCTTPRWALLSNGQHVTAFRYASAVNGSCELETRFCIDGVLQGSFANSHCEGPYPEIMIRTTHEAAGVEVIPTQNSIKSDLDMIKLQEPDASADIMWMDLRSCQSSLFGNIPQGESIVAYNNRCKAEFRMCNMGVLQGSFLQYSCQE